MDVQGAELGLALEGPAGVPALVRQLIGVEQPVVGALLLVDLALDLAGQLVDLELQLLLVLLKVLIADGEEAEADEPTNQHVPPWDRSVEPIAHGRSLARAKPDQRRSGQLGHGQPRSESLQGLSLFALGDAQGGGSSGIRQRDDYTPRPGAWHGRGAFSMASDPISGRPPGRAPPPLRPGARPHARACRARACRRPPGRPG
ncbi:hypothetical protein D3C87_1520940 [compost metagenome]